VNYGRSVRDLVVVWIVTVGALALLHLFEVEAPAFHELLIPFYWIIVAVAGYLTWRWLRSRSSIDRRRGDRRRNSRREDADSTQAAAPAEDREDTR
jgi:hypothetical protein